MVLASGIWWRSDSGLDVRWAIGGRTSCGDTMRELVTRIRLTIRRWGKSMMSSGFNGVGREDDDRDEAGSDVLE